MVEKLCSVLLSRSERNYFQSFNGGVTEMTGEQKKQITRFREEGYGYGRIASILGLPGNTVKSFCRRNGLIGRRGSEQAVVGEGHICKQCGIPIRQNPGRKEKKFCSDKCRNKWWNSHLDQVERKANYEFVCACCKKPFTAYGNADRKYCSHACYVADRFGGGADE